MVEQEHIYCEVIMEITKKNLGLMITVESNHYKSVKEFLVVDESV